MEEKKLMKKTADSRTIQHYLVMAPDTNGQNILFGGKILSWIDMVAGIVAFRHCDSNVRTVAIDHLEFKKSAYMTDVVTLDGKVTWVGHSSLEVRVDSYRENKGGKRELINRAYLVMVCVNDDGTATREAPGLILETEEEKAEWEAGVKRDALRKERRKENF